MSSLKTTRRWTVAPNDAELERTLAHGLSIAPLVARIMVARGIRTVEEGRLFLTPSLERDWADPAIIPGMMQVADRVEAALDAHESIAVFGDFDVDGITSTCLLTEALRALGGTVHPFIPHRFDEGYGLSATALERVVRECSPSLIITVDNGIAARAEVAALVARGIDVAVTDHHEPADLVPRGVPVADPKLAAESPSRELAGAGVALKLVHMLGERRGAPDLWRSYTEVAALGTVSDMMTLTPENRALVADGIEQMRHTARPGFIALAALARTDLAAITADTLSFSLIPRLNSAGRMADPTLALDLLLATDPIEAGRLASELETINQQRRDIEGELADRAMESVEATYDGSRVIVAGGEGWHEGVKGIVASRLTSRYHVPTLLFSISDGIARGSGRSVGSVNLFDAVEACSDLLIRFGGHAGAVGVTVEADKLDELRERLAQVLGALPPEDFEDTREVAALVTLDELDIDTIEQMSTLEPFGQGNKVPLLAATGVTMADRAAVGKCGEHMRFTATDGVSSVAAIMFRVPDIERQVACDSVVDLVFEAVAEHWQGRVKPKLMVKDILCHTCDDGASGQDGVDDDRLFGSRRCEGASDADADADAMPKTTDPSTMTLDAPALQTARRRMLAELSYDELTRTLIHTMIGAASPHPAQTEALAALAQGQGVLAIMGTGRGKSLIFQVHAAREAILNRRASVFVYPLRALVADQSYHITEAFAGIGVGCAVLTGETPAQARDAVFSRLARGELDVVLTTPEFLSINRARFAQAGRIGFLVVDEAHHAGLARSGERGAYLDLPEILAGLHHPTVLATTATANARVADEIRRILPLERTVIDEHVRDNLRLEDERDLASRENRLVSIVATGEKCVVYVNSRDQSRSLARMLRRRVPELAGSIAFYNAGLTRDVRQRVEEAFREGELTCIVSTSAFGEGVNLPDIRHVVLYHMPFGSIEFNQMSGRAGRDGLPARIHLLYSTRDARINERLLDCAAPERDELVTLYRALQTMWRSNRSRTGEDSFTATDLDIVQMCLAIDARRPMEERAVSCGLAVFEELGFARVSAVGDARRIAMADRPGHVDLASSVRYLEGIHARIEFTAFRRWALTASASDMLERVNTPITPRIG
ncbi:single-stranded-DNA-specific exonuclease RecJ [Collinsella tanakaei]|uniref:single-stranded-DNA-specific exonuclease RecJ n=1 Tax=Collinsella tanakaei TaxID=626935 RepID=UPI001F3729D3|nr:single-stranded-DNA-specific exonuclease RecJ [Collinsella tanakaei]MCF2622510.1 single-stranded-DNA-specific exonuclease RecJ [Collinsella tanakaei]